jgi:hypothetical protein
VEIPGTGSGIPVYVGERYLPGATADEAMAATERVGAAAMDLARAGATVRLISTTFVPAEEWMVDLFAAGDPSDVERVYRDARVVVGRVSRAVYLPRDDVPAAPAGEPTGRE